MLSVDDLTGMRETLVESLDDSCQIIVSVPASDNHGGQTITPTPGSAIDCRIAPRLATGTGQLKDAETIEGGRLIEQAPWMITLPYGTDLTAADRISASDGRVFEVFAVLDPRSYGIDTRVLCRLINQGVG